MLDHGIGTQWSPCMAFRKHSGLPVCHFSLNSLSVNVLYIVSWAGEWLAGVQIGSLKLRGHMRECLHVLKEWLLAHGIKTQWSPCMVFPIHSCLPVWHV